MIAPVCSREELACMVEFSLAVQHRNLHRIVAAGFSADALFYKNGIASQYETLRRLRGHSRCQFCGAVDDRTLVAFGARFGSQVGQAIQTVCACSECTKGLEREVDGTAYVPDGVVLR
jgi:hypothetical protein